jgi:hypothetical protein
MSYELNALLGRLVGYRMHSVQFALDYLQLHFDTDEPPGAPVLTCDVLPAVNVGRRTLAPHESGWSDALCSLIGQHVTDTREAPNSGVQINMATGTICLYPTREELVGPEIAMLGGFEDGRWMIWRPGEEAFEYL